MNNNIIEAGMIVKMYLPHRDFYINRFGEVLNIKSDSSALVVWFKKPGEAGPRVTENISVNLLREEKFDDDNF